MTGALLLASLLSAAAAVTVLPGGLPKPYAGAPGAPTPYDFFTQSAANEFGNRSVDIFMSNRDNLDYFVQDTYQALPSADSFVRGALQAWGEHLHLVLGPDELWLTVLAQVNFYMNAHPAEAAAAAFDLRANDTTVVSAYPDWYTIVAALYGAVTARIKPAWLQRAWISPNFTTSTDEHVMAAHILMLAQTRAFLRAPLPRDGHALLCGLPSVTLLGARADWAALQWRVEQLPLFGPDPAAYAARLRPVLRRFVASFDDPDAPAVRAFWNQIVVAAPAAASAAALSGLAAAAPPADAACSGSSNGPSFNVSGWITAFYYWDADGTPYGRAVPAAGPSSAPSTTLDNVTYPAVDLRTLPVSYGRTSFVLPRWNDTDDFEVLAMGGPLGKRIDGGAPPGYFEALNRTRRLGIAPWTRAQSDADGAVDATTDANNQTFVQWANASFGGYDPRAHATLTPLTSWVLYGPAPADAETPRSGISGSAFSTASAAWLPELELGALAAALLSHYNATQCAASLRQVLPRSRGGPSSRVRRHGTGWGPWTA